MALLKTLLLFFFIAVSSTINAQNILSGKVIDYESGEVIVGANVYINNTTIGCATNKDGVFFIKNVPEGKQELVISFVGYDLISYEFISSQLQKNLDFKLKKKTHHLNEVIISGGFRVVTNEPYHWDKFVATFIGKTPFSDKCIIQNKEDIELRLYEKNGLVPVLKAYAKKPIVIINEALGYKIEYDLEQYQSKSFTRNFTGKAYFTELTDKASKSKTKTREAAYYGSVTHFLRSVYHNTLKEQGFHLRSIERNVNVEKKKYVDRISKMDKNKVQDFFINKNDNLFGDSSSYVRSLLFQPDFKPDVPSKNLIKESEVKIDNKNGIVVLKAKDSLFSVEYSKPLANIIHRFYLKNSSSSHESIKSVFRLKPNIEVVINPKINSVTRGMGLEGFFSNFYGISTMLPEDFEPSS
ncbi:MAG: carboxypeptidase-like regulatory domain-containing protein [Pedobacter sp.]|nr:MAG: carboxypeptidase-like regulatory domain-containing protein [Pedobacter sp.]